MREVMLMVSTLLMATSSGAAFSANKIIDRMPFEFVMNVAWHGQKIEIRKVVSCNMRKRLYPIAQPTYGADPSANLAVREVWDQDINRGYYVLPSKEVLIIDFPHVCAPLNKGLLPLPAHYLPIMYWVDNANVPTEAEKILSYKYFTENARRRFELLDFSVQEIPQPSNRVDDDQGLNDLIESSLRKFDAVFVSIPAIVFPPKVWMQYPSLAAALKTQTKSGPIDRSLIKQTAAALITFCEQESIGIGPSERCGAFDIRPYITSGVQKDGVWRVGYDDPGVWRYFRYREFERLNVPGCDLDNYCGVRDHLYRFEIDGTVYEQPLRRGAGYYFDVKTQTLLGMSVSLVPSTFKGEPR